VFAPITIHEFVVSFCKVGLSRRYLRLPASEKTMVIHAGLRRPAATIYNKKSN
jgi:hypothetical protein